MLKSLDNVWTTDGAASFNFIIKVVLFFVTSSKAYPLIGINTPLGNSK